jgi:hypothetical protein
VTAARDLSKAQEHYRGAVRKYAAATTERLKAINAAEAAGLTRTEIASATGLSRARVAQLLGPKPTTKHGRRQTP